MSKKRLRSTRNRRTLKHPPRRCQPTQGARLASGRQLDQCGQRTRPFVLATPPVRVSDLHYYDLC